MLCGVLCCCAVLCCTDSVYDRNESCDGAGVLWSPGLGEGGRGKGEGGRGKGEGGRGKGERGIIIWCVCGVCGVEISVTGIYLYRSRVLYSTL